MCFIQKMKNKDTKLNSNIRRSVLANAAEEIIDLKFLSFIELFFILHFTGCNMRYKTSLLWDNPTMKEM